MEAIQQPRSFETNSGEFFPAPPFPSFEEWLEIESTNPYGFPFTLSKPFWDSPFSGLNPEDLTEEKLIEIFDTLYFYGFFDTDFEQFDGKPWHEGPRHKGGHHGNYEVPDSSGIAVEALSIGLVLFVATCRTRGTRRRVTSV